MYGGLFGDLPAANGEECKDETKKTGKDVTGQGKTPTSSTAKTAATVPLFIPQQAARRRANTKPSILPSKINGSSATLRKKVVESASESTSGTAAVDEDRQMGVSCTTIPTNDPLQPSADQQSAPMASNTSSCNSADSATVETGKGQTSMLNERFHKAVAEAKVDPYDPFVPNDLLQYWKDQSIAKEKDRLMRERDERIREQEIIRERLERERIDLEREGNLDKVVRHRMQHGAGRGRGGLSNLPAWVIAEQNKAMLGKQQHPDDN